MFFYAGQEIMTIYNSLHLIYKKKRALLQKLKLIKKIFSRQQVYCQGVPVDCDGGGGGGSQWFLNRDANFLQVSL